MSSQPSLTESIENPLIREGVKSNFGNFLRQLPIFSVLDDRQFEWLNSNISIVDCPKGKAIILEGQANMSLLVVIHGMVKTEKFTSCGNKSIVGLHRPGNCFGEISAFSREPSPITAIAIVNSKIAVINNSYLISVIRANTNFAAMLLELFARKLDRAINQLVVTRNNKAEDKLWGVINMFAKSEYDQIPHSLSYEMHLTHKELANIAGIERETVTRILNKWKKEGRIKASRNLVVFVDQASF